VVRDQWEPRLGATQMNDVVILRTKLNSRAGTSPRWRTDMNRPGCPHRNLRISRSVPLAGLADEGQAEDQPQGARGEPPYSWTAAEPADQIVVGKAVLHAPGREPVDINRIG
jgi:hypothetical protein